METLKDLKDVVRKIPVVPAELSDKLEKIKEPQGKVSDEDISCHRIDIRPSSHLDLDYGKEIPELIFQVPGKENGEYLTLEYPISANTNELLIKFDKGKSEDKPTQNSLKGPTSRP